MDSGYCKCSGYYLLQSPVSRAHTQLTALQREANELQVQYGRYLLEQSAWGRRKRVESMAVSKLGMRTPKVDEIVMVK